MTSGRKFFDVLNATFNIEYDAMYKDAVRTSKSEPVLYTSLREQDENSADSDSLSKDDISEDRYSANTTLQCDTSLEHQTSRYSEKKSHNVREGRTHRRRKAVVRTDSENARDLNDFLDNYYQYKKEGYYPECLKYSRKVTREMQGKSPYSSESSDEEPSSKIHNRHTKHRQLNSSPKTKSDKKKPQAAYGWDTSRSCKSKESTSIARCSTPSSVPLGWSYGSQPLLSRAEFNPSKKQTANPPKTQSVGMTEDINNDSDKRNSRPSPFAKLKARLKSTFSIGKTAKDE